MITKTNIIQSMFLQNTQINRNQDLKNGNKKKDNLKKIFYETRVSKVIHLFIFNELNINRQLFSIANLFFFRQNFQS